MSFLIASNNHTENSTNVSPIKTETPGFHKQKTMLTEQMVHCQWNYRLNAHNFTRNELPQIRPRSNIVFYLLKEFMVNKTEDCLPAILLNLNSSKDLTLSGTLFV